MGVIFQKKVKICENLGKNAKTLKIFLKWAGDCVRGPEIFLIADVNRP